MRVNQIKSRVLGAAVCLAMLGADVMPGNYVSMAARAQSLVSGDISGTVEDSAGAAVSGATVKAISKETGSEQSTVTSATGAPSASLF